MRYLLPTLLLTLTCISCKKDLVPVRQVRLVSTGTTDRLNAIRFLTPAIGICVGGERFDHSRLLRTVDGGANWSPQPYPEADKELFGITAVPNGRAYVIGYDGKLLYSDDRGGSWVFRQLRFETYKAIAMRGPDNPVAIGGISFDRGDVMELDRDGGILSHDSADYELNDIAFSVNGRAFRCGYGTIQSSTDSGRNWNWAKYRNDNYSAIDVRDDRVWICGREGSIVRSMDGGGSWERCRNGTAISEKKYRLNDIAFRTPDEGFAVGEDGVVLYSNDAGAHWSELESFTSKHLYGITFQSATRIFICGDGGAIWEMRF